MTDVLKVIMDMGAHRAEKISVVNIPFYPEYRKLCESNTCGMYGKSYMCPPLVGEIDALIAELKSFDTAYVYQTVGELEDSYDFEGMMEAGREHNELAQRLNTKLNAMPAVKHLHLGAGGCRVCKTCAKNENSPCRHPDLAMSSLEAYGIAVSELAGLCGMKYIHGENTVTYFGAYFVKENDEASERTFY